MKLENQVCSLKLAKKLKELGAEQKSSFYWVDNSLCINSELGISECCFQVDNVAMWENPDRLLGEFKYNKVFSAFTVAELGEILPDNLCSSGMDEGEWGCVYGPEEKELPDSDCGRVVGENFDHFIIEDKTEANARAKMLICLLGEK